MSSGDDKIRKGAGSSSDPFQPSDTTRRTPPNIRPPPPQDLGSQRSPEGIRRSTRIANSPTKANHPPQGRSRPSQPVDPDPQDRPRLPGISKPTASERAPSSALSSVQDIPDPRSEASQRPRQPVTPTSKDQNHQPVFQTPPSRSISKHVQERNPRGQPSQARNSSEEDIPTWREDFLNRGPSERAQRAQPSSEKTPNDSPDQRQDSAFRGRARRNSNSEQALNDSPGLPDRRQDLAFRGPSERAQRAQEQYAQGQGNVNRAMRSTAADPQVTPTTGEVEDTPNVSGRRHDQDDRLDSVSPTNEYGGNGDASGGLGRQPQSIRSKFPDPQLRGLIEELPDYTTRHGFLDAIKRIGTGYRVIVNRGTEAIPHYAIYPGSVFGKGSVTNWLMQHPELSERFASASDIRRRCWTDVKRVGYRVIVLRNNGSNENIQYFRVEWRVELEWHWVSRSQLISLAGKDQTAIQLRLISRYEMATEDGLLMMREEGLHPDTEMPLSEREISSMPWLAVDYMDPSEEAEAEIHPRTSRRYYDHQPEPPRNKFISRPPIPGSYQAFQEPSPVSKSKVCQFFIV